MTRHRSAVFLVIALAMVLVWLVLDSLGTTNPIRESLTGVIAPLQLVFTRAASPVLDLAASFRARSDLQQENAELKEQIAALRAEVVQLSEAQY